MPVLDGYVAAIVAGPVLISPLDWICPLLAIDADAFNHGGRCCPSCCAVWTAARTGKERSRDQEISAQRPHRYCSARRGHAPVRMLIRYARGLLILFGLDRALETSWSGFFLSSWRINLTAFLARRSQNSD
jgi:hypothetical protein